MSTSVTLARLAELRDGYEGARYDADNLAPVDEIRIVPSVRPDGTTILICPCGHQEFVDPHGKAVCPRCNRSTVVERTERTAVKEPAPAAPRRRGKP